MSEQEPQAPAQPLTPEQVQSEAARAAHARLDEFNLAIDESALNQAMEERKIRTTHKFIESEKEKRMDEMEQWANAAGKIAEGKAERHKQSFDHINDRIREGGFSGKLDLQGAFRVQNAHNSNDGVINDQAKGLGALDQNKEGDIVKHKDGESRIYARSPKNITKSAEEHEADAYLNSRSNAA